MDKNINNAITLWITTAKTSQLLIVLVSPVRFLDILSQATTAKIVLDSSDSEHVFELVADEIDRRFPVPA